MTTEATGVPETQSQLREKAQIESIWKLGGLTPKQLARRVWLAIEQDYLVSRASDLACNFLLAAFPMLLFLVSLFGLFASESKHLQDSLFSIFRRCCHRLPLPWSSTLWMKLFAEAVAKADLWLGLRRLGWFRWNVIPDVSLKYCLRG